MCNSKKCSAIVIYRIILSILFVVQSILILYLFDNKKLSNANQGVDFTRAAVIYYPVNEDGGDPENYKAELRWFERSWREMQKYEPSSWRTDILIFATYFTATMRKLHCTKMRRRSRSEIGRCIVIDDYVPMAISHNFTFPTADSINVVALLPETNGTEFYDWILRTDIDTFLTPAFGKFKPTIMTVGHGAYEWGRPYKTRSRLLNISRKLNLETQNLTNIGSTWYGPLALVSSCAKLSVEVMLYMHKMEFTIIEKSREYAAKGWPEWHYGVLSMYSGHIAINHCTAGIGRVRPSKKLDYGTTLNDSIWNHPHLHVWQFDEYFSKYQFFAGAYNNMSLPTDISIAKEYAGYIALDSVEKVEKEN